MNARNINWFANYIEIHLAMYSFKVVQGESVPQRALGKGYIILFFYFHKKIAIHFLTNKKGPLYEVHGA